MVIINQAEEQPIKSPYGDNIQKAEESSYYIQNMCALTAISEVALSYIPFAIIVSVVIVADVVATLLTVLLSIYCSSLLAVL